MQNNDFLKSTRISYPMCWDAQMLVFRSSLKRIFCVPGSDALAGVGMLILTTVAIGREF